VRIPDFITGAVAGFDFDDACKSTAKPAALSVIGAYLADNRSDCFQYRFKDTPDAMKLQRLTITAAKGL